MKNSESPIHPQKIESLGGPNKAWTELGLTKREYFAGLAMQGLLAHDAQGYLERNPNNWEDIIGEQARNLSDALLKQLEP